MSDNIIEIAKKSILLESETLKNLANQLDESFEKAVRLIYNTKGRIIISGVGKSALIAQKVVATLNSTGSLAIFMHGADAAHGDLGMVTKNDILICISKSGETAELKLIIPIVKSRGTKVIAICSKRDSYIMKASDQGVFIPLEKEAEPNNLAPTASSTAQLALGDAIAITLLSLKGFSPNDFAMFHPGGHLGKQLYLKVEDLWKKNAKPFVHAETILKDTLMEISSKRIGAAAILDNSEKVIGIITDGDLRRMLSAHKNPMEMKAGDIMTKNPIMIRNGELAYKAFQILREKSINQIIVHSEGKYLGMIHIHDFIKEGFM